MKILHTPFPAVIIGFLLSSFNQLQTDSRQVEASLDNKNSVILENSIRSQTGGTTPQQQDPDPNALILVDQQPEPINLEDIKKQLDIQNWQWNPGYREQLLPGYLLELMANTKNI